MTPKEKAKELISRFDLPSGLMSIERKQCALIAVDEIINSNPCIEDSDRGGNFQWASNSYFWQQVKNEIELL